MALPENLTDEQVQVLAGILAKFTGLGFKGQFTKLEPGPVITGYYFKLSADIPLARILNKEEDFAMAAHASSVTISRVGGELAIFVPNRTRKLVDFRDSMNYILTNEKTRKMKLPITLGVSYHGEHSAIDLTEQPHILIAGETGSGKSVFESAVLCTLAIAKSPRDLELYLVDTKKVDLPLFEQLPHVKGVVKEHKDFEQLAQDIIAEMELRLKKLAACSVRNIHEYNNGGYGHMPYIILMIDEYADLNDQDIEFRKKLDKEDRDAFLGVKGSIKRIGQKSRAAGIHLICGTQRSSVKNVDGDIKVNLPCRIALRLPTATDSVTILGEGGAESLLGKGDMFVVASQKDRPERFHGPYVELSNIEQVVMQSEDIRKMYEMMHASQEKQKEEVKA